MNHHDIRLIEIGQKEGYAKAVREIAAWLRFQEIDKGVCRESHCSIAEKIEAKFGDSYD